MNRRLFTTTLSLTAALALLLSACTTPTPTVTTPPTPKPTSSPTPPSVPADGTVYFLVSETGEAVHQDSFVLPLTKPEDIAAARAIVADRAKGLDTSKIVLASIAKGLGDGTYVNRDFFAGSRTWSWYIAEFLGFPDMTVEIYDGWPGYVEENLDEWIRITEGRIGFWSYTVTRELTAAEVAP